MKIKISIEKKYGYVIISLIVLIVISGIVYAYIYPGYTTDINPTPAGHGGNQIWVTTSQGDQQFLQDSINRGDLKPHTGKYLSQEVQIPQTIDDSGNALPTLSEGFQVGSYH